MQTNLICALAFKASQIPPVDTSSNTVELRSSGINPFVMTIVKTIDTTLTGVPQTDFSYISLSFSNIPITNSNVLKNITVTGTATIYKQ